MTANIQQPHEFPEPDHLVLHPRDVQFDWSALPAVWIPKQPLATHVINVLHLLLPAGERWFVHVFKQALPLIRDDKLRQDVLGFIGQESVHSQAHAGVLDHFAAHGLDATPYTDQIEYLFERLLGDRDLTGRAAREWLIERVAAIAAIEHLTAVLGNWILNSPGLDRAQANPTMLDLLRWHGAEEVEHRCVSWDLAQHLDRSYWRRARTAVVVFPVLAWLWIRGAAFLMRTDPGLGGKGKARWRDARRAARIGLLPPPKAFTGSMLRYFRRNYYPAEEGSTAQATAYLASSPAARAAGH